jgi:hypothetical protein
MIPGYTFSKTANPLDSNELHRRALNGNYGQSTLPNTYRLPVKTKMVYNERTGKYEPRPTLESSKAYHNELMKQDAAYRAKADAED